MVSFSYGRVNVIKKRRVGWEAFHKGIEVGEKGSEGVVEDMFDLRGQTFASDNRLAKECIHSVFDGCGVVYGKGVEEGAEGVEGKKG